MQQMQQIYDLAKANVPDEKIAKKFGMAIYNVQAIRRALGIRRMQAGIDLTKDFKQCSFNKYSDGTIYCQLQFGLKKYADAIGMNLKKRQQFKIKKLGKGEMTLEFKAV